MTAGRRLSARASSDGRRTLTSPSAKLALARREQGYTAAPIAREVGVASTTVSGWLDRVAARFGFEAVETKMPEERGELEVMTTERLEGYSRGVQDNYRKVAVSHPDVVSAAVFEALSPGEDRATTEGRP